MKATDAGAAAEVVEGEAGQVSEKTRFLGVTEKNRRAIHEARYLSESLCHLALQPGFVCWGIHLPRNSR